MDLSNLDPGALVLGGLALLFSVLAGLAIRKMARGQMHAGEQMDALEAGPSTSDEAPSVEDEPPEDGAKADPDDDAGDDDDARDDDDAPARDEAPVERDDPPEAPAPPPAPDTPPLKPLKEGLTKTRKGFMARLNDLIFKRDLDEDLVDELEALLVTSDVGIKTTERLLRDLRGALSRNEISDPAVVRTRLRDQVSDIVHRDVPPIDWTLGPTVVMVIGVNGVGKTTTIGKLASRLTAEGKKVVLGAGDTFRAAAVQQLEVWGERAGAKVVKGDEGADPASVVFDAIQQAQRDEADVVLCDTAGRLHTKVNLMEELKKLRRVMNKAMPGAPHEVLMVLDATTGQNGINQAEQFKAAVEVSSIALTKLDGTAKGGVVVAICDTLGLPVRYVGIGEGAHDLRDFSPSEFVDALFAD